MKYTFEARYLSDYVSNRYYDYYAVITKTKSKVRARIMRRESSLFVSSYDEYMHGMERSFSSIKEAKEWAEKELTKVAR